MSDGYLFTWFQLGDINKRWTDIEKHEDYCAGHLIEAAIAYYNATGKRKLLDVVIRFANHIDSTMRLQNKRWFSGHQEIELALMKLYHHTGNDRYLKLTDWYLQQRGHKCYAYGRNWITPDYWQDMAPVKEQKEITGHAVRAMYLYSGAADVAAVTGDTGYVKAMKTVWEDVVYRNMYITGGIGSAGDNEGFSKDYDLPNELVYCETCALVGMVFWNHRMNQLTAESKYFDVLKRSLYNGALDGLSLDGDRFFYENPLASSGQHQRREWYGTACCPANIARLVASVGDYIYGRTDNSIWVNLFVGSQTKINSAKTEIDGRMETNYPWDGKVKLNIDPKKKSKFRVYIRIPGWSSGQVVPGNLYQYGDLHASAKSFFVNGRAALFNEENGYAVIEREWNKADVINFEFEMPVKLVVSKDSLIFNKDRVAIQRGPLLYCMESIDNDNKAWNIILTEKAGFATKSHTVLNENIIAIQVEGTVFNPASNGNSVLAEKKIVTTISYYVWANRGPSQMQIWMPTKIKDVKLNY